MTPDQIVTAQALGEAWCEDLKGEMPIDRMTGRELSAIESQLGDSTPYYLPRLCLELRLTHDELLGASEACVSLVTERDTALATIEAQQRDIEERTAHNQQLLRCVEDLRGQLVAQQEEIARLRAGASQETLCLEAERDGDHP